MSSEKLPPEQQQSKAAIQVDLLNQLQVLEFQNKELAEELRSLKERFTYVLKATRDTIWDVDLVNNIRWYSDGLETLFGHGFNVLSDGDRFWLDSIHPQDKDRVTDSLYEVIDNGGMHWHDRYRFKRGDGTYAWVLDRGYVIRNSNGKAVRMVGSMQDVTAEIEAKEILRESEEKFRGAFDQAAVGINIASPTGHFLSVNKAYPKIFGYTEEELLKMKISDLSHPDEIAVDQKVIKSLLEGDSQNTAREKRYLHKSGKVVWGRVFGTVIRDDNNRPKYIVGVLEDITAQREATEALREREERLRLVIDSAKIGTWDFNPSTGNLIWDDRCKEMFGMAPEDKSDYETFLSAVHPEDRQLADETNQTAIKGINNGEYDLEYRTIGIRDGKLRWVRAKGRSYHDENGACVRYAGTVIDITTEKKQQQLLREQEERFRLLATSIPQIVWTTDAEGEVEYISDKWEQYTGSAANYEKFGLRQLMHPDDLERILPDWNKCLASGVVFHAEYRLINIKTNEYRWYSGTIVPFFDENNKLVKWIGSATDIHDQKTTEIILEKKVAERTSELQELNQQLEKSNSELEQYAYVTSHDLKEPLRKIRTYNTQITTKYSGQYSTGVAESLSKIESAATRMSGLIEDLLKYSRLSNPATTFDRIDLGAIVKNVRAEFEYLIKDKNISIDTTSLPVINAVPVQMNQLFFNLISNAIKFSKPDVPNRITISGAVITQDDRKRMGLTADKIHDKVYHKITFSDEGIGFSNENSEKIFTIFQRLTTPKEYEGHGIGLALCRKIVSNHHGYIWATGEETKGAVFTIILPEKQ